MVEIKNRIKFVITSKNFSKVFQSRQCRQIFQIELWSGIKDLFDWLQIELERESIRLKS